jgi:hypothetical protein
VRAAVGASGVGCGQGVVGGTEGRSLDVRRGEERVKPRWTHDARIRRGMWIRWSRKRTRRNDVE